MDARGNLTASLRDLYKQLSGTTEGFPPLIFWQVSAMEHTQKTLATLSHILWSDASPSISTVFAIRSRWNAYAARR